jgi:hypothetical protein
MQELIENLTEQLDKIVKEHQTEVNEDTYWRGVKNGLETAILLTEQQLWKEKEQHKQTWLDSTAQFDNAAEMTYKKDFEQYYNETFNTNRNENSARLWRIRIQQAESYRPD